MQQLILSVIIDQMRYLPGINRSLTLCSTPSLSREPSPSVIHSIPNATFATQSLCCICLFNYRWPIKIPSVSEFVAPEIV
jgi:hypothetical protein